MLSGNDEVILLEREKTPSVCVCEITCNPQQNNMLEWEALRKPMKGRFPVFHCCVSRGEGQRWWGREGICCFGLPGIHFFLLLGNIFPVFIQILEQSRSEKKTDGTSTVFNKGASYRNVGGMGTNKGRWSTKGLATADGHPHLWAWWDQSTAGARAGRVGGCPMGVVPLEEHSLC